MQRLVGEVQNYAWGSTSCFAGLRGDVPTAQPEAEIWYGAHPKAPSTFLDDTTLLDAITANPEELLGSEVVEVHGGELPFLVKLLAADSPLSIQAHPTAEQALAGCRDEDAAGIDRAAPHRCFRDGNPKPELIYAVSPFEALVGFRSIAGTSRFLADIGFDGFSDLLANGPKAAVEALLDPQRSGGSTRIVSELISRFVGACSRYSGADWSHEAQLMVRLNNAYPNDPGIGVAALLNYLVLEPGEALFLDAGHLHAYVSGLAVEVMANSDNVLRGGLTPKHIDVPTLLDIVTGAELIPELAPRSADGTFLTPASQFALRAHIDPVETEIIGPQIVLAVKGSVVVASDETDTDPIELAPTEAVWINAGERAVLNGTGLCFSTTISTG